MMSIIIILHVLSAVIWVGGMFFAYMAVRPVAANLLEPPLRLTLWSQIFARFFPWVWLAVILLLLTGYWMIFGYFGGFSDLGPHIHAMLTIGMVMMALFMYLNFGPVKHLNQAVADRDWEAGGKHLGRIRQIFGINLSLGLLTIAIASGGRFLG